MLPGEARIPPASPSDAGSDTCTVLHVDMDAFFAAVEVLDDPSLRGLPVIVGGSGQRGVVASCTYEARVFGIHSAMSSLEARRRCPDAVFISGRYWRYAEVSGQLFELLHGYTPRVEAIGLDEAFLDVAGARRIIGPSAVVARRLRQEVRERLHLDCSVGVARTKMLAKLASEAAKPLATAAGPRPGPGVVVIEPEQEIPFLHRLPVRALWGVGPATASRLAGVGAMTVADVAAIPEESLCRLLGVTHGRHLARLSRGEDDRSVLADRQAKSIGHEETFVADLHHHDALHQHVLRMADAVSERLRESGLRARTITVKVRFGDRATITRSHTLGNPTGSARAMQAVAAALLEAVEVSPGVRLLGVSCSGLTSATVAEQLTFDEAPSNADPGPSVVSSGGSGRGEGAWEDVEAALSAIRARYGQSAVAPAALLDRRGLKVKRRGDTQWGPEEVNHGAGDPQLRG